MSEVISTDSFILKAGERIAIMGASGCGKTTLLRSICLLDPANPNEVKYLGQPIAVGNEPAYRSQVLYVAQHSLRAAVSTETHLEQLLSLKIHQKHGISIRDQIAQARAIADLLGKSKLIGEIRLDQISGGESQILAVIRALLLKPRVLCLDEPTSALDSDSRERVEKLLADRHTSEWIWVTHDDRQAARIAQRIVRL